MSLALLIYLANVLPNVASLLFILGWTVVAIQALFTVYHGVSKANFYETKEKEYHTRKFTNSIVKMFVAIPLFIIAVLIPSERIIYLMAAASVGQQAIGELSPELTKIRTIINEKLDGMLEEVQQ